MSQVVKMLFIIYNCQTIIQNESISQIKLVQLVKFRVGFNLGKTQFTGLRRFVYFLSEFYSEFLLTFSFCTIGLSLDKLTLSCNFVLDLNFMYIYLLPDLFSSCLVYFLSCLRPKTISVYKELR